MEISRQMVTIEKQLQPAIQSLFGELTFSIELEPEWSHPRILLSDCPCKASLKSMEGNYPKVFTKLRGSS